MARSIYVNQRSVHVPLRMCIYFKCLVFEVIYQSTYLLFHDELQTGPSFVRKESEISISMVRAEVRRFICRKEDWDGQCQGAILVVVRTGPQLQADTDMAANIKSIRRLCQIRIRNASVRGTR